ncbi:hypothetical protein [Caulobacter sp. UNC279MFTsu5.1]|uniref:hypothetical protein n=1 Tax=Caulobacter sp. UNC279MFTsu5.1 TaxID=1502775 RepID=UPI002100F59C|nr:hypothetical protein [Caulobacter sp. UNC279MFTsu5.1]
MPRPPRVYQRGVKKLTRVKFQDRTLHFTFPQNTGGGRRSAAGFVGPDQVPAFEGDEAWFEMELVEGLPWNYWRAVRQVEGPANA